MLSMRKIIERWRDRWRPAETQPLQFAAIELEPSVMPAVPPEQLLLKHRSMLLDAERMVDLELADWDRLVKPLIRTVAGYYHLLPASEAHHHCTPGGLLEHSLQTAMLTMRASATVLFETGGAPATRRENEKRWRVATFAAALLHDCAKPLSDVHVTAPDGELRWNPLRQSLWAWLQAHNLPGYCVTFRRSRHANHELRAFEILHQLLPIPLMEWMQEAPNEDIYRALLGAVTGSRQDTVVHRLVEKGDSQSTDIDLRENAMNRLKVASKAVPALSTALTIMQSLVADGTWTINAPGSRLFLVRHATGQRLYLIWNKAAAQVIEQLRFRRIVGVDRDPDAVLSVLADARVIVPRVFPDGQPPTWLHTIAPDPVTASLGQMQPMNAVQIADPRYLLGEMPLPTAVGAIVNDEFDSLAANPTARIAGEHPEATPECDIYVPRRPDGSALLCKGCHNSLRLVRLSHAAWNCTSCGCFYDNYQLFDVTGQHPPVASATTLDDAQRELDTFMADMRASGTTAAARPPGREIATQKDAGAPPPAATHKQETASPAVAAGLRVDQTAETTIAAPAVTRPADAPPKPVQPMPWTTEYGEVFVDVIAPPGAVSVEVNATEQSESPPAVATVIPTTPSVLPSDGDTKLTEQGIESGSPSVDAPIHPVFGRWALGGQVVAAMLRDVDAGTCGRQDLFVPADGELYVVLGGLKAYGLVVATPDKPAPVAMDVLRVLVDTGVVASRSLRSVGDVSGYQLSSEIAAAINLHFGSAPTPEDAAMGASVALPADQALDRPPGDKEPDTPDRSRPVSDPAPAMAAAANTAAAKPPPAQRPASRQTTPEEEADPDLMPWADVVASLVGVSTAVAVDRIVGMIMLGDQRVPGGVRLDGKRRVLRQSGVTLVTEQLPRIRNSLLVRIGRTKEIVVEEDGA